VIENTIRQYITDELNPNGSVDDLSDDYPLLERSVLDSLGLFQLVGYLESEFGVEIADEELLPSNFGSIHDIARLVREKRA
jgi:acyl carrier protein